MRIALVQYYLKEYGGAEAVFETLADIFPDADIYTTLYCPRFFGPHRKRLEKKWGNRVHQSFFKYIPFASKIISPLRLLSPLAFKSFNFSSYDLIITSATGAYFPNALRKKKRQAILFLSHPPSISLWTSYCAQFQKISFRRIYVEYCQPLFTFGRF